MKATGIVRRIDDLGRVVIPKEIRRTMRIREGDPLEIYTDKDGEVIFKKYSPIGELSDFAAQICDSLHKSTDAIAAVCDRDTVIAISGGAKRELMDKRISAGLEHIIEGRSSYRFNGGSCIPVSDGEEKFCVSVAAPVVSEGDVMGCVLFICQNGGGAFLLIYLLFVVLFGCIALPAEFAVGRWAGTGTLGSYARAWRSRSPKAEKAGGALGWLPLAGSMCIAIGYAVIVSYVLKALVDSVVGTLLHADTQAWFAAFSGTPYSVIPYHVIVVVGTLLTLKLYEQIRKMHPDRKVAEDFIKSFTDEQWQAMIRDIFGKAAETVILQEHTVFHKNDPSRHAKRLDKIIAHWDDILRIIDEELPSCESIAAMMERGPNFLHWMPGDHTRLAGKMQFHYRLNFDADGRPMLQVFNTCKHFIRTLPNLVYDESNVEDIDTRQEDHIYDECRYVLMENPISPPARRTALPPPDDPLDLHRQARFYRI